MNWLSNKEIEALYQDKLKIRHYCKNCGHTVIVVEDKNICSHCKNYVFKDDLTEFKYRLKQNLLNEKRSVKK